MQTYEQQTGRPKAVPVQIGTNWTHVHVGMFVATVLSCGLAAPFWAVAAIIHAVQASNRKPQATPQQTHTAQQPTQQFQQGHPKA